MARTHSQYSNDLTKYFIVYVIKTMYIFYFEKMIFISFSTGNLNKKTEMKNFSVSC